MPISSGMEIPAGLRSGGAGEQQEEQVERRLAEGGEKMGENVGRMWGKGYEKGGNRGGAGQEKGIEGEEKCEKEEINEKVRGGEDKRQV